MILALALWLTARPDTLAPCVAGLRVPTVATGAHAPAPPPLAMRALLGEYGTPADTLLLLERDGRLHVGGADGCSVPLRRLGRDRWTAGADTLVLRRRGGRVIALSFRGVLRPRRAVGPDGGGVFRIVPQRPVDALRTEALQASPPDERGDFLPADLAELTLVDSTIHLDIRYAGTRNFLSTPFYSQARAFLQRPAAEALARVSRRLRARGFGLLVHDGYRPWYVTKMFWEATPPAQREFVADPATGSRHNRGAAADLTLYDRRTGRPIEMPGAYDESTWRSYPWYPGGTSRQRWHRDLLRAVMEQEGFAVFGSEWWHFDFGQWRRYRVMNTRFEDLR